MEAVRLILGAALLTLGRRLFWLFVAAIGFVAGLRFANELLADQPAWIGILVGVIVGLAGAGLAVLFQQFAIGLAGFLGGSYVLLAVLDIFGLEGSTWTLVALLAGGIAGAVLMFALFDWALILLSSIAGANLVVEALQPNSGSTLWLLALVILGVIVQSAIRRRKRRPVPLG